MPVSDAGLVFHALGDPTRRAMVERLSAGPVPASTFAAPLSISLAAVVQHLQVLEHCGLVRTEKVGRVRLCRLERTGLDALDRWVRERTAALERPRARAAGR